MDEKHFSREKNIVKRKAYEPSRGDAGTSVFLVTGLKEPAIWRLGKKFVAASRGKPILARADLKVGPIRRLGLDVIHDPLPRRHALVVGWPSDKEKQKLRMQEVADEAVLRFPPKDEIVV